MEIDSDSNSDGMSDIIELRAALQDSASKTDTFMKYMKEVQDPKIAKIDAALAINEQLQEKYKQLEEVLNRRLCESREKLTKVRDSIFVSGCNKTSSDEPKKFRYHRLVCKTYFDTKDFGAPPDNYDTKLIRNSKMINVFQLPRIRSWGPRQKRIVTGIVLKMSQSLRREALTSKLLALQRTYNEKGKEDQRPLIEKEMQEVRNAIVQVKNLTISEVAMPIDYEYFWDAVSNALNAMFSPNECRSLWKQYLHPSINKSNWTKKEHLKLEALSRKYGEQNWNAIAQELGTGRSQFQCFVYYRTNISKKLNCKWTPEEDDYLKLVVEFCRTGDIIPWGRVSYYMENKTRTQVYQRWTSSLIPDLKKGRFLPEEDEVLLTCIKKYGADFKKATAFIPGRTSMQLRNRYYNCLINKCYGGWTLEEDRKLLQLAGLTNNYTSMKEYFPGRTRISIRLRHQTLVRWTDRNPHLDISLAPRRTLKYISREKATDLKTAVAKLKQKLSTLEEAPPSTRPSSASRKSRDDRRVINYFINNMVAKKEHDVEVTIDEKIVKIVLLLLGGNIQKTKFEQHPLSSQFTSFFNENTFRSGFVQRTYGSKNHANVCRSNIWEESHKMEDKVFLPPNYTTIVALRTLFYNRFITSIKPSPSVLSHPSFLRLITRLETVFKLTVNMSNVIPCPKLTLKIDIDGPSTSEFENVPPIPSEVHSKLNPNASNELSTSECLVRDKGTEVVSKKAKLGDI